MSTSCDVAGCRYLAMHICEPHVRARSQEERADLERQLADAVTEREMAEAELAEAQQHNETWREAFGGWSAEQALDAWKDLQRITREAQQQRDTALADANANAEKAIDSMQRAERFFTEIGKTRKRLNDAEQRTEQTEAALNEVTKWTGAAITRVTQAEAQRDALVNLECPHGCYPPCPWDRRRDDALASLPAAQETGHFHVCLRCGGKIPCDAQEGEDCPSGVTPLPLRGNVPLAECVHEPAAQEVSE